MGAELQPGGVILLGLLCYLAPLKVVLAFLMAAFVHELGHIFTIAILGGKVQLAGSGGFGTALRVSGLLPGQECIAVLAGPLLGLCLLPLGRFYPQLALFALAHSLYNLLPIYPLDGGRAFYCGLTAFLGEEKAWAVTRILGIALSGCLALGFLLFLPRGLWFLGGIFCYRALALLGNFSCNGRLLSVQ